MPVDLTVSFSSSAFFVSAGLFPGKTSIEITRSFPPGATSRLSTSSGSEETFSASPPASGMRQTCCDPPRVERK